MTQEGSCRKRWFPALLPAWALGLLIGVIVWVLRRTGHIEVRGFRVEKFLPREGGVVLYHRHPSVPELMIIPVLFFSRFLLNPSMSPLITPDKAMHYDRWWWIPLRPISIPVPGEKRGNAMGRAKALVRMRRALQKRRIVMIALEGGRTWKGETFKEILPGGKIVERQRAEVVGVDGKVDLSRSIIRHFQKGAALLASEASFVPVWVQITRWRVRIVVGDPLFFDDSFPREEITPRLEDALLKLVKLAEE